MDILGFAALSVGGLVKQGILTPGWILNAPELGTQGGGSAEHAGLYFSTLGRKLCVSPCLLGCESMPCGTGTRIGHQGDRQAQAL